MELLVIRHGQSVADIEDRHEGRAAEVAEFIERETGAPIRYHDGLREWDNGVLAGLKKQEALVRYPLPREGRRPHEPIPGGESAIQIRARAEHVFSELMTECGHLRRVAVISHGGLISMLFRAFLGLPLQSEVWLMTADTGVHRWVVRGASRWVLATNLTAHLEERSA